MAVCHYLQLVSRALGCWERWKHCCEKLNRPLLFATIVEQRNSVIFFNLHNLAKRLASVVTICYLRSQSENYCTSCGVTGRMSYFQESQI